MKLAIRCATAAALVVGVLGVVSVGTASATQAVLCKVKSQKEGKPITCPTEDVHPSGALLGFELKSGSKMVVKAGAGNLECEGMAVMTQTTAASGEPIPATTDKFVLSSCNATATISNLPWETTISWISGTWNANVAYKGSRLEIKFGELKPCIYEFAAELRGDNPAELVGSETPLNRVSGAVTCANPARWSGVLRVPPEYYEEVGSSSIYVEEK